jgi:putative redox protein
LKCTVKWTGTGSEQDGMAFIAQTGSGHIVAMDGAPEGGGNNLAPRPMEMVLLGTGGCTAYDVVLILRKSKQDIRSCDVVLEAERADTDPKVFTKMKPNVVERAIKLSHDKYCSASVMLAKTAALTLDWEIVED